MSDRINLVDAYSNRSVVAKLAKMEDEINGAQDSISTQTESFTKLADKKTEAVNTAGDTAVSKVEATRDSVVNAVTTAGTQAVADVNSASASGVKQVQDLLDGLDETVAKAEAAATTAEQASKTADEASDKAEAAAKSVDDDVIAAANAVVDAKAYATTGVLHDGTTVTSADAIEKQCETIASQVDAKVRQTAIYEAQAETWASEAVSSAQEADSSASKAKASESVCATSETNAKASETNAKASADSAGTYAGECLTYKQACDSAKTSCETSATSAQTSATQASSGATMAGKKSDEALSSAQLASGYATRASASATASANSAQEAKDAAASINPDNFVTVEDYQEINGTKKFTSPECVKRGPWTVVSNDREMITSKWEYCYGLKVSYAGTQYWQIHFDTDFGDFTALLVFDVSTVTKATITNASYEIVENHLRGPSGTTMTLGIEDGSANYTITFALKASGGCGYTVTALDLAYIPTGKTTYARQLVSDDLVLETNFMPNHEFSIPVAVPTLTSM